MLAATLIAGCLLVATVVTAAAAAAPDITELLDAAARAPGVAASELGVRQGELRQAAARSRLLPKVALFSRAELYNSPTNLRPMPPTEVNVAAGDSLPFSRPILRYGLNLEVPVYVGPIYRLADKMRALADKARAGHRLALVQRQATVLALDAGFLRAESLRRAIAARRASLEKTRQDTEIAVRNGRAAAAELLKLDNAIAALDRQADDIAVNVLAIQRDLATLTGIEVASPAPLALRAPPPTTGDFLALAVEKAALAADRAEAARQEAGRWPALKLIASLAGNDGEAYNTDTHVFRDYAMVGLTLTMPLFDRVLDRERAAARVAVARQEKRLRQTARELMAQARELAARLPVLDHALATARASRDNARQLLEVARVARDAGRTTTEEYLRYEADLLAAEAEVARLQDAKWQVVAKQAVLYGADLTEIVGAPGQTADTAAPHHPSSN